MNENRPAAVDADDADQLREDPDAALVAEARQGSGSAVEALVQRHQAFLYNVALRMLYSPQDAEDATQEILVRAITRLSSFEGRSRFRTWLYLIATNHLLNMKRGRMEPESLSFADYGHGIDTTAELDVPDSREAGADTRLLVDEARIGCTMAMLLCFDREQRLAYVLGEIMGAPDALAAEVLDISREAFRQRLSRARRDLHSFMNERCGLVDRANACRCARKMRGFMQKGYVDPEKLLFARAQVRRVRELAPRRLEQLEPYQDLCADVFREHPFYEPANLPERIRQILESPEFKKAFTV